MYADRPTGEWIREGALVAMDTLPLDLDGLTRDAAPSPLPPGAEIGHIHMNAYVDLDAVVAFYRKLGMSATWKMLDAVFLARGGSSQRRVEQEASAEDRGALAVACIPAMSKLARTRWRWRSFPLEKTTRLGLFWRLRRIRKSSLCPLS